MVLPAIPDAVVNLQTGDDKLSVMRGLIKASIFTGCLRRQLGNAAIPKGAFSLAIKVFVDYEAGQNPIDFSTDPELVDCLIAEIVSLGISEITIFVDRLEGAERYVAKLRKAGYTVKGLADQPQQYDFGSFLREAPIAKAWLDADFRISFGKIRTNPLQFFEASISNIQFSAAEYPALQRKHANGLRSKRFEHGVLLADRLPVHFGFADAWLSVDGSNGSRLNPTRTLLAAENLLALDWVVGEKMGLDPALNPTIQEAMHRWGTLHLIRQGNTTPWDGWKNVPSGTVAWNQLFKANL